MRFGITRLCGGKALMVSPKESIQLDLLRSAEILSNIGDIKENEDMIVMSWNDMEVTIYHQGKIMFHPLSDKDEAIEFASFILDKVV